MALRALAAVCTSVFLVGVSLPAQQSDGPAPLRIFIRAGEKTHGAGGNGLHDYPAFLGSWSTILKDRGAVVNGALHFPTADELAATDVLINFKGDGGTCSVQEKNLLEAFVKRGGGIVTMHDGMCSSDAPWFATMVGGAKQHGVRNFSAGQIEVKFTDTTHEITRGLTDFEIDDEAFFMLRTVPELHVLATAPLPSTGEVTPQLWTAERSLPGGRPHRSFEYMLGHRFENFAVPQVQTMMLRGIAWVGRRPVDLFTNPPAAPARGGGGGGRRGGGAREGGAGAAATPPAAPAAGRGN
jgi:type 1 glutamine amidotransferase